VVEEGGERVEPVPEVVALEVDDAVGVALRLRDEHGEARERQLRVRPHEPVDRLRLCRIRMLRGTSPARHLLLPCPSPTPPLPLPVSHTNVTRQLCCVDAPDADDSFSLD